MGFFDKIKAGLTKTREALSVRWAACFPAFPKSTTIFTMNWRRA